MSHTATMHAPKPIRTPYLPLPRALYTYLSDSSSSSSSAAPLLDEAGDSEARMELLHIVKNMHVGTGRHHTGKGPPYFAPVAVGASPISRVSNPLAANYTTISNTTGPTIRSGASLAVRGVRASSPLGVAAPGVAAELPYVEHHRLHGLPPFPLSPSPGSSGCLVCPHACRSNSPPAISSCTYSTAVDYTDTEDEEEYDHDRDDDDFIFAFTESPLCLTPEPASLA